MSEKREEVLQAVLDKLWSSALEFADHDRNEYGNPTPAARERWQRYAEAVMHRWLEYHSPSARDRAVEANRQRRKPEAVVTPPQHCPYCGELRDQVPCPACGGPV